MNSQFKNEHSRGFATSRKLVTSGLAVLGLFCATVAWSTTVDTKSLDGRWVMKGIPVEAGDAVTAHVAYVAEGKLTLTPPKDLIPAVGTSITLIDQGSGVYAAAPGGKADVTFSVEDQRTAHLSIKQQKPGKQANFEADLVRQ